MEHHEQTSRLGNKILWALIILAALGLLGLIVYLWGILFPTAQPTPTPTPTTMATITPWSTPALAITPDLRWEPTISFATQVPTPAGQSFVWLKRIVEDGGFVNGQAADAGLFVDAMGNEFWAVCIQPGVPVPSLGHQCVLNGSLIDCGSEFQNFWLAPDHFQP
jgi:hypothetical protein